jgi:hypothetical protein
MIDTKTISDIFGEKFHEFTVNLQRETYTIFGPLKMDELEKIRSYYKDYECYIVSNGDGLDIMFERN